MIIDLEKKGDKRMFVTSQAIVDHIIGATIKAFFLPYKFKSLQRYGFQ